MIPRRFKLLFGFVALALILVLYNSTAHDNHIPSVPTAQQIRKSASEVASQAAGHLPKPKLSSLNPLRPASHKPPEQANSTSGSTSWYSDWKWLNPFSSSITLDENRAVLPPLKTRPPIYTFYDASAKKSEDQREAEEKLLLIWRRAWWAQGFDPRVLGWPEAMNNPFWQDVQQRGARLPDVARNEIARWLAWSTMGGGILSNWLVLPMAAHDDTMLSFLRRGEYSDLTRYETLQDGLWIGEQKTINSAIKEVLNTAATFDTEKPFSMATALGPDAHVADKGHGGVAFYDKIAITSKYPSVAEKFQISDVEGYRSLALVINSHLHLVWRDAFSNGIAVLKPFPEHMTALVKPAMEIAQNVSQCSDTPEPASCPPNLPKCRPCVASQPLPINQPPVFRNASKVFHIGTVPHPYTFNSLLHRKEDITIGFLRRETKRDQWIFEITKELLGYGKGGSDRVVPFKGVVASDYGSPRSLWLTAERESPKDLDWIFGFQVSLNPLSRGESETPVPGPERRPPPPKPDGPVPEPSIEDLKKEQALLDNARARLRSTDAKDGRIVDAAEAWNLADAEAWKFARAYSARRRVERLKWEEEEEEYAGAEHREKGWGRWFDKS